jgi:hypothetical protein
MKKYDKSDYISKKRNNSFCIRSPYSKSDLNDFCSKSLLANILNTDDDFGVIGKKINCFKPLKNESFDGSFEKKTNSLRRDHSLLNHRSQAENMFENCFSSIRSDVTSLRRNLNLVLKEIRLLTLKLREEEIVEEKSLNWKFAAMVIDRLCMVFFTVTFLISTGLVLFTSENFFKSSNPNEKF